MTRLGPKKKRGASTAQAVTSFVDRQYPIQPHRDGFAGGCRGFPVDHADFPLILNNSRASGGACEIFHKFTLRAMADVKILARFISGSDFPNDLDLLAPACPSPQGNSNHPTPPPGRRKRRLPTN
jgi:hypothetical protein